MAVMPKAWLVSELMAEDSMTMNVTFMNTLRNPEFDDFVGAVNKALRGVEFHRISPNVAVVYRKGEIFALGEIGFRDVSANGGGVRSYYVQSRRIVNAKYRESSWQHRIVASKSLRTATRAAATYLVPFDCREAVGATQDLARKAIQNVTSEYHTRAREAFRDFTGEAGYNSNMSGELMKELRTHTFISPALNEAAAAYYAAYDQWKDVEGATKNGVYYVGITDNYGQQIVDTARVAISYPYTIECFDRVPAEAVADWVKGRVAVLSMVEPMRYVQGVGVRIDDKVFYVIGERDGE